VSEFEDRRSRADRAELIADPVTKARREAENGIRQFEMALDIIERHTDGAAIAFDLTPSLMLDLHRVALDGLHVQAGLYRTDPVTIAQSRHVPPWPDDIAGLVVDMCRYINEFWHGFEATELAAYVLWRINWIHPFADGNGRTARIVSYVILSVKLGYVLPGSPSIPEQIANDKEPYYRSLEEADEYWQRNFVALSSMEKMLERMLERQLRGHDPESTP
jgi:Fic family protein